MARRHIIRSDARASSHNPNRQRSIQKLQARREKERVALSRWQKKLKRAFNAVSRIQKLLARIDRQINQMENP